MHEYVVRIVDDSSREQVRTYRGELPLIAAQILEADASPGWSGPTVTVTEIVKQPRVGIAGDVRAKLTRKDAKATPARR